MLSDATTPRERGGGVEAKDGEGNESMHDVDRNDGPHKVVRHGLGRLEWTDRSHIGRVICAWQAGVIIYDDTFGWNFI
ncbi:hypothetical protein CVT25_006849 [Psilocybe cyanescens]|uniref:Uncharacterized protein n=1 Tax=Psilocybe cyanescens TaxID=93625 RepID=A0A409X7F6_PSICY|nr:hypothetical protein CVT25_006849 [Psilocybe cyanescens]